MKEIVEYKISEEKVA